MRVAILLYPTGSAENLRRMAKGLAEGFSANGHSVEIIDLKNDESVRVGIYDYLCIGTEGLSPWSGKIDSALVRRLDSIGSLSGKRCFAFVTKKLLFTEKLLVNLMKAMEAQGMFMRNSAVFKIAEDAKLTAKNLDLDRSH
jgi:hypothetical protein